MPLSCVRHWRDISKPNHNKKCLPPQHPNKELRFNCSAKNDVTGKNVLRITSMTSKQIAD